MVGLNTNITVLIKPSYLVAVGWPTGMTVCEHANVICASSAVYACVCVCALSVSVNNLQVYACWSLFWAALVTESETEREAEELSIFSRGIATEKICLGGTVITSLFSPPSSVPLSPHLLRIYTVSVYPSIYPSTASPVSIVRPKQSVWCALAVIYFWMPAHLGRIRFKVCAA